MMTGAGREAGFWWWRMGALTSEQCQRKQTQCMEAAKRGDTAAQFWGSDPGSAVHPEKATSLLCASASSFEK